MSLKRFDLTGKVALITGGNKGLGKAMARGLAEAGADIFLASRSEESLKSTLDEILTATGRRGGYTVCDVSKRDQVTALAATAEREMGKVDILINNAGTNIPQAIDEITDEVWDNVLEVNLNSIMALTRALVPGMKQRKWGRVIHISSIMGVISKERRNIYSATKAALIGMAKASAIDLGAYGITVNCIGPGPFLTDLPMSLLSDSEKAAFAGMTALNRWGQPDELVGPALLLASDAGAYITGTLLLVDGGYTAR
ncbi:SDR family NAD(P)-dependent oxidoreductase [Tuwongella immobilis]|uniref:Ketoreductase domain-containing protein n=1 Tax=Tuwongella immobilis TaxID=692036 RepID=A0A6C2YR70_9BACT|nr:SDR family oxidoreductase [Tuwongella immobilis]VIP03485.1 2-deoxy-d-gluconate 3-dehydrogenase : 3-oxoacyl-(Acyl-carrier protein) reductase OS=Blastopirellula marina DSM 3645 GN=DSM3645_20357 PE=3 SV=1: adh_short [Tuwongella immobilis]VTS04340.1 2-deoxy-d-gluconate 3-dehydrogenase : 3-oxoacyl-(Acyl-carrier protein) reductase OS=Blastopirellula marina DSM 3645 GN=DSM3645_20357 PE=3 SV=1: adh_short [Tuwongella immobilis]